MKKLIFLFATLLMLSCSDDDSGANKTYLPTSAAINGVPLNLQYDSEKRLTDLTFVGYEAFHFTYQEDRITEITKLGGNDQGTYTFTYDGETITSYSFNGQNYPVVYNQPANALNNGIVLYENGELKSCKDDDGETILFTYDDSKKGAWHNGNGFIVPLIIAIPDAYQYNIFLSKYAIANFTVGNELYSSTYEYNNRNFPGLAYFVSANNGAPIEYSYQNL